MIDAVKKLGADIFHNKSLRGEKDKCASWDLILLELKGQIKLHNLRMRILNKFEFFYSSLVSTYSQKESFVDSEKIDDYTVLDLNKFDTDVQDSRKAIRNLLNDSIYRPFISEISRSPFGVSTYWPEQLTFWRKNSVKLQFFAYFNAHSIDIIVKKSGQSVAAKIVLFQIISELHGQPVPLFQSLVDYSDKDFKEKEYIKFILGELLKEKVSACRILMIEVPSLIFFEVACNRYNYSSFQKYNDDCFEYSN